MKGSSLLKWWFLATAPMLVVGCAASQVPDAEAAAEAALDEAGETPADHEEALSESEKAAREWKASEGGQAADRTEEPKKTGKGLVVLPAVEREEGEDEESDPDLDAGDDLGGGSVDDLPDDSVGAIDAEEGGGVYEDEDE